MRGLRPLKLRRSRSRGLRPLELPAFWVLFAAGVGASAMAVRCGGDDSACADAACDVSVAPLAMTLTPDEVWVHPGDAIQVNVALARGPGGDGDAVVTIVDDAGAAVTADPLTIPSGNFVGTLAVHVGASFAQGDATSSVVATAGAAIAVAPFVVHVAGGSGAADTSFGTGGVVDLSPTSGVDVAAAMIALQSGLVIGGTHVETGDAGTTSSMKVVQLTSGGGVDGAFAPTSAPGELWSLARMPDGRIFAVGALRNPKADFAAVRVLAGGGLDPTYAVDTPITLGDDVARAAVVEPGGRLVATGPVGDASAVGVARYTQVPLPVVDAGGDDGGDASDDAGDDGAIDSGADAIADAAVDQVTSHLDPSFGDGGIVVTALAKPNAGSTSMVVAADGSLYVLGYAQDGSTDVIALHYDTAGALTQSVSVPLTTGTTGATAALLQPDGAIVVATDDNGQALTLRLLPNGDLDPGYGVGGLSALAVGPASGARALARDPASGDLVVGGFTDSPHQCFVARVSATGALVTSFASGGVLSIHAGDACDVAAVAVDDAGKIVVLETVSSGGGTHMAVARYWP